MSFEFQVESIASRKTVTVLRVRGRLDARSASALTADCAEVRRAGRHLVLNLSEVSFIASSGIGALLALVEEFRQAHLRVRLAAVSPPVDSIVRLLNLEQFLHLETSEEDATAALEAA
jgi:anti-anti-sigma factor